MPQRVDIWTSLRRSVGRAGRQLPGAMVGAALAAAAGAQADDAPAPGEAQAIAELTRPSSTVEVGVGGFSHSAGSVGNRYRLEQPGAYLIGDVDLRGAQYSYGNDDDDMTRWRLIGNNLGLPSRSLSGEYGQQGSYRLSFGYDQSKRLYSDSYQTPFVGAGSANLSLPAGFVRGANTSAMTNLAPSMQRFDVQTTRQRSEVGLSYWLTPEWELKFGLRNEQRDGSTVRGAEFGSNGGNPRAALLPEPVDSTTQLIDASLGFAGEDYRFNIAYHGSIFRNNIAALTWQNPYTSAPWVGGASGLPANFALPAGRTGVAPDNEFHQIAVSGSYDFSNNTRLSVTATKGRMTQNSEFLPYTINPGLTSTGLPRGSLDGVVDTTFLNARLSLRPLRNLFVNAALRYEDRDNNTPQAEYIYVGGDIQLQPQPLSDTDRIRTNLPRSRRQQQFTLDTDYRMAGGLAFKAGWDRDDVRRTFAEVERAVEDTYRVELRQGGTGPWSASAGYALLQRRGTQYLANAPYLASYTSAAYINGLAAANGCVVLIDCIRNGPLQNKFYLADRDRERARVLVGYTPDGPLSVQARVDLNHDHYPRSPYGVTGADSWSAGADLAYLASDNLSVTAFYTMEDRRSSERSRQITSVNPAVPSSADSDWVSQFADRSASIGFGVKYQGLLGGRLELGADAIAVRGRTAITTTVGPAVPAGWNPVTALPDLTTHSDELNFSARHALDRESALRLVYSYRRVSSADWATQQVGEATLSNLIGTNQLPTRYSVHGLGISYVFLFR